jgi:lysophospholipase L1-like esterase
MYTILGDSWVSRLERHVKSRQPDGKLYGNETIWLGVPGLTCARITGRLLRQATRREPDVVILHVGGNDLASLHLPTVVVANILTIRQQLLQHGAKRVLVTEIPPRRLSLKRDKTKFTQDEKICHEEAVVKANETLRAQLGLDFIRVTKKIKFPRHYGLDGVHLTRDGNQALFYSVLRGLGFCP